MPWYECNSFPYFWSRNKYKVSIKISHLHTVFLKNYVIKIIWLKEQNRQTNGANVLCLLLYSRKKCNTCCPWLLLKASLPVLTTTCQHKPHIILRAKTGWQNLPVSLQHLRTTKTQKISPSCMGSVLQPVATLLWPKEGRKKQGLTAILWFSQIRKQNKALGCWVHFAHNTPWTCPPQTIFYSFP